MSKFTRTLTNADLQTDPHDPEFAREIRRRKKRKHKRPVKEAKPTRVQKRRSLLEEDTATGVMPSGRKQLL